MKNILPIQTRALVRPGVQYIRGVSACALVMQGAFGKAPLSVFLPAYGRRESALLRIYNIASELRKLGWRSVILPSNLDLNQRLRFIDGLAPNLLVMQGVRHTLNRPA